MEAFSRLRDRGWLAALAGALLIGVISSGIWDIIAKPGLSRVAGAILRVVTLGSTTVRDLPYESASLDPTALPSLLVLQWVLIVGFLVPPTYLLMDTFLRDVIRSQRKRVEDKLTIGSETPEGAVAAYRKKRIRLATILLAGMFLVMFWIGFVTFNVVNKAIAIRRIYSANIQILTPYISAAERDKLLSTFAQVTTKQHYDTLQAEMQRIAKQAGVVLRPELVR